MLQAGKQAERQTSPMQNLVLIVLDTLRRDRLSAYGHARETSPAFDAFAARGVQYTRAVAPAQWTIPAHASLFTGLLPSEHGVTQSNSRLSATVPTLAEQLHAGGYHTVAFCNNALVSVVNHGMQRGFEHFYTYASAVPHRPGDLRKPWLRREFSRRFRPTARRIGNWFAQSETLFRLSLNPLFVPVWTRYINFKGHTANSMDDFIAWWDAWQAGGAEQPVFAFLNLMGAHTPYQPPQDAIDHVAPGLKRDRAAYEFVRRFNADAAAWASPTEPPLTDWQRQALLDFYDAEIFAQDQQLGRALAHLEKTGALANTTVIILADHGESHGDHDLFGHGFDVHHELTHVPMAIRGERFPAGARDEVLLSTRWLHGTLLDLAGLAPQGAPSLAQGGLRPGGPVMTEAFAPLTFVHVLEHRNPSVIERRQLRETRRAVLDGRFKLMLRGDQPTALYDVLADPAETRSVLRSQPEAAAQLQRAAGLLATGAGQGETAVQDAEVLEHLRALGYVD
jgi:arylsulfatase A-like enzyme